MDISFLFRTPNLVGAMRLVLALIASLLYAIAANSSGVKYVELSDEQHAAVLNALVAVLPNRVAIDQIRAFTTFGHDPLSIHAFSTPYNIQDFAFNVDALNCTLSDHESWDCRNYETLTHIYVGSVDKTLWLKDGIQPADAIQILRDALQACKLDFDVFYELRPQLSSDHGDDYFKFWAPKCHYQYRKIDGSLVRSEAFHVDTK